MKRGMTAGSIELLALEWLLTARGERGVWEERRAEQPLERERERVPAVAGADDQPA
ncbi:MAG: hypothetical protein ACRDLP_11545 [Solirubrobacteraceae bacterium]